MERKTSILEWILVMIGFITLIKGILFLMGLAKCWLPICR